MMQNNYLQLLQILKRQSACLLVLVFMFLTLSDGNARTHKTLLSNETTTACGITVWGCNDRISVMGMGTNLSQVIVMNTSEQSIYSCNYTCNPTEELAGLLPGTYTVIVKLYNANYIKTCSDITSIVIAAGDCGNANGGGTTGGTTDKPEKCDGKDNDGDGLIDEGFADSDWDGHPPV